MMKNTKKTGGKRWLCLTVACLAAGMLALCSVRTFAKQTAGGTDAQSQAKAADEKFKKKLYTTVCAKLYKKPSGKSRVICELDRYGMVYFGWKSGRWSRVRLKDGTEGYVPTKKLTAKEPKPEERKRGRKVIVIDAGHQARANFGMEPLGPGSREMKMKETGGTAGVVTKQAEYQLNLEVSLKLRDKLDHMGYNVILTRKSNNVDLGNIARANVANRSHADAFIRIHANSYTDSRYNGVMTICQTASNPYNAPLYGASRKLSQKILDCVAASTGAKKLHVWETDTMCGINWSQSPVTILEMGFLSNPQEDVRLSQKKYQNKIVRGIADGVDRFFSIAK